MLAGLLLILLGFLLFILFWGAIVAGVGWVVASAIGASKKKEEKKKERHLRPL